MRSETIHQQQVQVHLDGATVSGALAVPLRPHGVVVLAGGIEQPRLTARIRTMLFDVGLAALVIDTFTSATEADERDTSRLRLEALAERVIGGVDWLARGESEGLPRDVIGIPVGCCGAGTAAAAVLIAAAERRSRIGAVVCHGGRVDLAAEALPAVTAPTLLIAADREAATLELNRRAQALLAGDSQLEIVPGAGCGCEGSAARERLASLTRGWFVSHLRDPAIRAELREHRAA